MGTDNASAFGLAGAVGPRSQIAGVDLAHVSELRYREASVQLREFLLLPDPNLLDHSVRGPRMKALYARFECN